MTDLGSANGSFLDGARFKEELQLHDGAELRIGSVKVKIRIVAEEGDSEATIMVDIDEVTGGDACRAEATRCRGGRHGVHACRDGRRRAGRPGAVATAAAGSGPELRGPHRRDDGGDGGGSESFAAAEVRGRAAGAGRRQQTGAPRGPRRYPRCPPPRRAKKGRHPAVWVAAGCGGCLLAVILFAAAIGGGVYYLTRGAPRASRSTSWRSARGIASPPTGCSASPTRPA